MATSNRAAMNTACLKRSPFLTPYLCPFLILFLPSSPCQVLPCRLQRKEAPPWFHPSVEEAVIVFDTGGEIRALPQFTRRGTIPCSLPFLPGHWVSCVCVDGDDARCQHMGGPARKSASL